MQGIKDKIQSTPETVTLRAHNVAWAHYFGTIRRANAHLSRLHGLSESVAERVYWLNIKTEFGSRELFWYPFFELIAHKAPLKQGRATVDDEIWDLIIPIGYRALKHVREHVKMPDHAGELPARIPNLFNEVD